MRPNFFTNIWNLLLNLWSMSIIHSCRYTWIWQVSFTKIRAYVIKKNGVMFSGCYLIIGVCSVRNALHLWQTLISWAFILRSTMHTSLNWFTSAVLTTICKSATGIYATLDVIIYSIGNMSWKNISLVTIQNHWEPGAIIMFF